MKKKISIFCSLLLALQMMLSLAVVPVFADEELTSAVYEEPESPAVTYNMNVDWKFKKAADGSEYPLAKASASVAKDGKNFYDADYDDSDWDTVSVPHPINAEDSFDGACYDAGEAGLYRGFMFYRKHITIPESDAGKKLFLEFEAVRNSVYLYVDVYKRQDVWCAFRTCLRIYFLTVFVILINCHYCISICVTR